MLDFQVEFSQLCTEVVLQETMLGNASLVFRVAAKHTDPSLLEEPSNPKVGVIQLQLVKVPRQWSVSSVGEMHELEVQQLTFPVR